jgi:hypothetical protein
LRRSNGAGWLVLASIQPVLLEAGLKENLWTENYAYGFAKAILQRLEMCSSRARHRPIE